MDKQRKVRLIGQLVGDLWMGPEGRLDVDVDLTQIAARFVNADGSGLIDAVKSVVDNAGDFQSARLTADSFITITHTYTAPMRSRTVTRFAEVLSLPSLADFVDEGSITALYQ